MNALHLLIISYLCIYGFTLTITSDAAIPISIPLTTPAIISKGRYVNTPFVLTTKAAQIICPTLCIIPPMILIPTMEKPLICFAKIMQSKLSVAPDIE